jgi:hypothetical protein
MIPNHQQFIEAIAAKTKVCLRFYSIPDAQVVDRICAPLEYGPGSDAKDEVNRYWFWDYSRCPGPATCGFVADQILDLQVLGERFDPSEFVAPALKDGVCNDEKADSKPGGDSKLSE